MKKSIFLFSLLALIISIGTKAQTDKQGASKSKESNEVSNKDPTHQSDAHCTRKDCGAKGSEAVCEDDLEGHKEEDAHWTSREEKIELAKNGMKNEIMIFKLRVVGKPIQPANAKTILAHTPVADVQRREDWVIHDAKRMDTIPNQRKIHGIHHIVKSTHRATYGNLQIWSEGGCTHHNEI